MKMENKAISPTKARLIEIQATQSELEMSENTKTPIEQIWVTTTCSVLPREGDYVSVSAKNIQQFAEALFAKFEQELCVALENYDDDHLNGLIKSAREQLFPTKQDDMALKRSDRQIS